MHYDFVRQRMSLKASAAMVTGVTAKLWEMSDLVGVIAEWENGR